MEALGLYFERRQPEDDSAVCQRVIKRYPELNLRNEEVGVNSRLHILAVLDKLNEAVNNGFSYPYDAELERSIVDDDELLPSHKKVLQEVVALTKAKMQQTSETLKEMCDAAYDVIGSDRLNRYLFQQISGGKSPRGKVEITYMPLGVKLEIYDPVDFLALTGETMERDPEKLGETVAEAVFTSLKEPNLLYMFINANSGDRSQLAEHERRHMISALIENSDLDVDNKALRVAEANLDELAVELIPFACQQEKLHTPKAKEDSYAKIVYVIGEFVRAYYKVSLKEETIAHGSSGRALRSSKNYQEQARQIIVDIFKKPPLLSYDPLKDIIKELFNIQMYKEKVALRKHETLSHWTTIPIEHETIDHVRVADSLLAALQRVGGNEDDVQSLLMFTPLDKWGDSAGSIGRYLEHRAKPIRESYHEVFTEHWQQAQSLLEEFIVSDGIPLSDLIHIDKDHLQGDIKRVAEEAYELFIAGFNTLKERAACNPQKFTLGSIRSGLEDDIVQLAVQVEKIRAKMPEWQSKLSGT